MASLVAVEGPLKGQSFKLQNSAVVGRSFDADIRVDDLTVSRRHAQILLTANGYVAEDLGSGNGTFVNEQRVEEQAPLTDGDRVRISTSVFRFAAEAGPRKATASVTLANLTGGAQPTIMETLNLKATLMEPGAPPTGYEPGALVKAHERLRTVVAISNAVQNQLDLDKLLDEIMDGLFRVLPQAERGFIMLKSEEGGNMVPWVARRRDGNEPEAITISRKIVDEAVQRCVAILSANAMSDQRFSGAMSVVNFRIRSMMCAPIIANNELLGIIHLDTTRQDQRFNPDDLELFTGVANQTAFAIANARMIQKLIRQERIERDLQLARQVQESFLPGRPPEAPGMQFCASYRAAQEIGGDFYDFISLPGGRLAIMLGDVAGKGVPAALMMARRTSDLRSFALAESEPAGVVRRLNAEMASSGSGDSFLTLIFAVLDPAGRVVTMVNAGHPAPLLRKADGTVSDIQTSTNYPVGALEEAQFEQEMFHVERGDVVCVFSDGITEAMNAEKNLYGTERLRSVVARPAAGAQQVMENILKDIQTFVGGAYQSDDLTLVCFGAT